MEECHVKNSSVMLPSSLIMTRWWRRAIHGPFADRTHHCAVPSGLTIRPPVVSGRERDLLRSVLVVSAFPYRSPHCPSKSDPTTQLGDSSAHKPKDRIPGVHECDSKGRTSDGPPTMIERLRLPDIQQHLRDDGHNTEKIQ